MTSSTPNPKDPADEAHTEEQNDEIIAVAFRRSLLALAGIGILAVPVVALLLLNRGDEPEIIEQDTGAAATQRSTTTTLPSLPFTDITRSSGIDFVHETGAQGDKLLPETMGGGVAFFDADNDGDQDLLFTNGTFWPNDPRRLHGAATSSPRLYLNNGSGQFSDATYESGLHTIDAYTNGLAIADYDGDGDRDIFFTAVGRTILLRNDAPPNATPRYTDVTDSAGVAGSANDWSTSAGFFDADNDGDLDLFVCRYVVWSPSIDLQVNYQLTGIGRAYGPPTDYRGVHNILYRNNGDGTFTDISQIAGIHASNPATGAPVGKSLGVVFVDIEPDGDLDIIVASDTTRNLAYINNSDGTFTERAAQTGLGYDGTGRATGAMGIDASPLRADGGLAIAMGNFANEPTSLYTADPRDRTNAPWRFVDAALVEGIGGPTRLALTFGLFFFDADLDGRPDLLHANGHVEDEINRVFASQHFEQPAQLFWNAGINNNAAFVELPPETTGDLSTPIVGRGAAYADIDGDLDLDLCIVNLGGQPLLLRNDANTPARAVRLSLVGTPPNTDAIGATITAEYPNGTITKTVMPTRSYQSQVELPVTIGLGDAGAAPAVTITWPDGTRQSLRDLKPGESRTVTQPGSL